MYIYFSAAACNRLLQFCLITIDSEPEVILRQENFEELLHHEVANLTARDSLRLKQESVLFSALERWAGSECRRRGVEPTPFNKRAVLSDEIWYNVRYLLMNDKEFIQGPMASGILSSEESAYIVSRILGHGRFQEHRSVRYSYSRHIIITFICTFNLHFLLMGHTDPPYCSEE